MNEWSWMPDNPTEWAARGLLAVAFVCFAWVGWVAADSALVGVIQERELDSALEAGASGSVDDLHAASTGPVAPRWGELEEGDLVGRIDIERLDVSAITQYGVSARTLRRAVGLIPGTSRPGEGGNVGLAGHRDSFFRELGAVTAGDRIRLTTPHGIFQYRVDSTAVVRPQDVHVLDDPAEGELLTLVTCYPFYYVGPAPERFIVHARRVTPGG